MNFISIIFISFLTLISFASETTKREKIPIAEDSHLFFPVAQKKTLILRGLQPDPDLFGDLNKVGDKVTRVRSIPVSFLSPFKLKEGMTIQFVYENGEYHSYKLNKMVNVLLVRNTSMKEGAPFGPYWSSFNLILTDNPTEIKELTDGIDDFENAIGFAYVGKAKTLQASKKVQISSTELQKNDSLSNLQNLPFLKPGDENRKAGEIRRAEVYGHSFYIQPEKREDGGTYYTTLIKSKKGNFYTITPNNSLFDESSQTLLVHDWIKDYKASLYKDPFNEKSCLELLLISSHSVEEVQMKCDLDEY